LCIVTFARAKIFYQLYALFVIQLKALMHYDAVQYTVISG